MKIIGIILMICIWVYISCIPLLYKESVLSSFGLPFLLGLTQGGVAIYIAIKFYRWFVSNLKS